MLFTEELSRKRYASRVVHSLIPPQHVFDLAEVLSSRMLELTEGRMWIGAHVRRGDCKHPSSHRYLSGPALTLSISIL
jgi:hypothetical protein